VHIRIAAAAMCGLVAFSVLGVAKAAAPPGKLRAAKSASGAFAVTAVTARIRKPAAMWVRLLGGVNNGTTVASCSRGFTVSANHYNYRRAGTYRVPVRPARADSCQVVASVGGSGHIRVEIRAQ
jgi:hypothetical protein